MKKRVLAGLIGFVMAISLAACSGKSDTATQKEEPVEVVSEEKEAEAVEEKTEEEQPAAEEVSEEPAAEETAEEEPAEEEPAEEDEEAEPEEAEETSESEDSDDEIDPDFKAAMDSYEEFFDEYCEFMTKYAEADSTTQIGMLGDYTELLTKYTETMEEMDNMDTDSMNDAELKYYIEVTTRIQEKLMKVSVDIGG